MSFNTNHFNTGKLAKNQRNVEMFGACYKTACGYAGLNVSSIGFTRNVTKVTCERCLETHAYLEALKLPVVTDPCRCGRDMFEHFPFVNRDEEPEFNGRKCSYRHAEMGAA